MYFQYENVYSKRIKQHERAKNFTGFTNATYLLSSRTSQRTARAGRRLPSSAGAGGMRDGRGRLLRCDRRRIGPSRDLGGRRRPHPQPADAIARQDLRGGRRQRGAAPQRTQTQGLPQHRQTPARRHRAGRSVPPAICFFFHVVFRFAGCGEGAYSRIPYSASHPLRLRSVSYFQIKNVAGNNDFMLMFVVILALLVFLLNTFFYIPTHLYFFICINGRSPVVLCHIFSLV